MKPIPTFHGIVKDGKLLLDKQEIYEKYLIYQLEGQRVSLTIELQKDKRSLSQNALYWVYLGIIANETGDNENDLHEYLKRKILAPRFIQVLGKEVKLPGTTSKLDKLEFGDYMDKIAVLTAIPVPNPEDAGYIK